MRPPLDEHARGHASSTRAEACAPITPPVNANPRSLSVHASSRVATIERVWRGFRGLLRTLLSPAGRLLSWLATLGTAGYPPDTQRRLKIINMISVIIVISTLVFAYQQAMADYAKMRPVILMNLLLAGIAMLVPLAHRINDIAGALLIAVAELFALLFFTAYFGRSAGTPLMYVAFSAAPFVVFGLGRIRLVLATVFTALALHLYAWFSFPRSVALLAMDNAFLNANYLQGAVTTFGLIAASVYYAFRLVERAKAETESLLRNILPDSVVDRLKASPGTAVADSFEEATVLFCDITGFVPLARRLGAAEVVRLLNRMVSEFDALASRHGVEKIKTIGDAYMAVAGVPERCSDCPERAARLAIDMLAAVERLRSETGLEIAVRIGLATGPVMAGVIGTNTFSYDVWGDAVNMAARLESLSTPGRIHVCPDCGRRLEKSFVVQSRGLVEIKGLGPRETWYLERERT